jgi:hypothetical protein
MRRRASVGALAALMMWFWHMSAAAQEGLFRCPGPPAVYLGDARLAAQRGCPAVHGVRAPARPALRPQARSDSVVVARPASSHVVSTSVQLARDDERTRILRRELQTESEQLIALKARLAAAPDVTGAAEATPLARDVARTEQNIVALERELSRQR